MNATHGWFAMVCAGALAAGCGGGGGTSTPTSPSSTTQPAPTSTTPPTTTPPPSTGSVSWQWTGTNWQSSGTPPACPSPLIVTAPSDMNQPTSVLYPGQSRPDYKPHAGFRYDGTGQTNAVTVVSPMDGVVFRGARFLEGGEIQYTFDLINACGIMHRVGHLRELSAKFQAIADTFPPPPRAIREPRTSPVRRCPPGKRLRRRLGFETPTTVFTIGECST